MRRGTEATPVSGVKHAVTELHVEGLGPSLDYGGRVTQAEGQHLPRSGGVSYREGVTFSGELTLPLERGKQTNKRASPADVGP